MYATEYGINLAEDQEIYRAEKRLRAQGSCPFHFLLIFLHPSFSHSRWLPSCYPLIMLVLSAAVSLSQSSPQKGPIMHLWPMNSGKSLIWVRFTLQRETKLLNPCFLFFFLLFSIFLSCYQISPPLILFSLSKGNN